MSTPRGAWPLIVAALIGAGLFLVPVASAGVKAPKSLVPASLVKVDRMPVFTWAPVKGADHYEFQIAADKGFNSTAANGRQATKNTAVTLPTSLINGTYYWRVRSISADNKPSGWTKTRTLALKWAPVVNVTTPLDGASFITPSTQPSDALILRWGPMAGAAQYAVSIATDPLLTTMITAGGNPEVIDGTAYTVNGAVPDGIYFWSVTPLDAEGHKGLPSTTRSFIVHWNSSAGSPVVTDLAADPELMDPLFSWGTVLGASSYEVEISTSSDFAPGSKVVGVSTSATSISPTALFQDNTYYWRVRPYDASNNAGPWTLGTPFTKTFDNVPPLVGPSVTNIRLRDMSDIGSTSSMTPVVQWDPVMGASKYEIEFDSWNGTYCDGTYFARYTTPVPAWSPEGSASTSPAIGNAGGASGSGDAFPNGSQWCVQVRAFDTDAGGTTVVGDWSLYNNYAGPLLTYSTANPAGNPPCNTLFLCPQYYVTPVNTSESQTPPVFVWKPITGAQGYFIVVSKDPNLSNIIDYVYTNKPVYAPRKLYADETVGSQLYWVILPTAGSDGSGYLTAGNLANVGNKQVFNKQSIAPAIQPPNVSGAGVSFQWSPLIGASSYTLQVSTDSTFSNILEEVNTDSASYTAAKSYPAGQTLYYRVRANDGAGNGLTWATGVFARTLAAPVPAAPVGDINPAKLDGVPNWSWSALPGATAYDVHVDYPSGATKDVNGIHGTTSSWTKLDGLGVWKWKVRAEFGSSSTVGPWSAIQTFTRTFGEPTGRRTVVTKSRLIISWDPKQGAKTYHLQVSNDPDFSSTVDDVTQDAARFAPALTSQGYADGGRLLWRVAAVDAEGNQGDWSPVAKITLAKALKVAGDTSPARGKAQLVTITVTNVKGAAIKGVSVRVSGSGAIPRAKQTNKKGKVALMVRPTSKGTVTFRATKSGYQLSTLSYQIT
jgi:large repetitive protein